MSEQPYDFTAIESKWQSRWAQQQTFKTPDPGDKGFDESKPKFYGLDMFPYPSGVGLHVGHPLGYIATDINARFKRMTGHNVLHTMGFDAFGLPAEQFAVEHGVHPRTTTEQNIANMTRQLKALGLGFDWSRSVATTDVGYYKWTQWIFLQLYNSYFDPVENRARPIEALQQKLVNEQFYVTIDGDLVEPPAGNLGMVEGEPVGTFAWTELDEQRRRDVVDSQRLAYVDEVPVNWCPALGTVLANEEVTNDGRSERGNHPVYRRPLRQWMLRITAYAERLLADLEIVDWPEAIKSMQRNWIGRSEGAMVDFVLAADAADAAGGEPAETEADDGDDAPEQVPTVISVFTTRPDTLFGATYMVLAPEHPLVDSITTADQRDAVTAYQRQAAGRSDVDRMAETKEKTGVFTGAYAINPLNGEQIPIWIADYVLTGYGTGAIMAVPAHDQRDFEFARRFDLPIRVVVMPDANWLKRAAADFGADRAQGGENQANQPAVVEQLRMTYQAQPAQFAEAFAGHGLAVNSSNDEFSINDMQTPAAQKKIIEYLERRGIGQGKVQYKLRDWLFSRQRYWGEPFPILIGPDGEIRPVDEDDLPVELPEMDDFTPAASDDPQAPPQPPLARAPQSWRIVEIDGVKYHRELNTMPQWAGSCWYYLRYIDPDNDQRFVDPHKEQYWMAPTDQNPAGGVDLYVGGVEHAVLHLLYARFWHKVLYDLGHVSTPEPFGRLFNQGYIQAYAYQDERGIYVDAEKVVNEQGQPAAEVQGQPGQKFVHEGKPVTESYGKMGKSLKNAIAPDDICSEYGADTLRLYEMYMGPLDASKPWATRDIIGVHRFLQRVWRNFVNEQTGRLLITSDKPDEPLLRLMHKTIRRVTDDMGRLSFNTAIAALIEMNNQLVQREELPRLVAENFVLMLSPLAPHLAEELWERMGNRESVTRQPWPRCDADYLVEDQVELIVQVQGKLRGRVTVSADADEDAAKEAALADEKVASHLEGKTIRKVIYVPGKLINIVAG
jgi:leucyl-tRNA synthetase